MKKTTIALSIVTSLFIAACGNNNTTTNMPDSGYKPRTDTTNPSPVTTDSLPRGATAVDTITMGQTNPAGVPDSAHHNKKDSSEKKSNR